MSNVFRSSRVQWRILAERGAGAIGWSGEGRRGLRKSQEFALSFLAASCAARGISHPHNSSKSFRSWRQMPCLFNSHDLTSKAFFTKHLGQKLFLNDFW